MKNQTIFQRLFFGYLMILLAVAALGLYASLSLDHLNKITRSINAVDGEIVRAADRLRDSVLSQRGFEKKYIISKDEDFYLQFIKTEEYIEKDLVLVKKLIVNQETATLVAEIEVLQKQYLSSVTQGAKMIKAGEEKLGEEVQDREKKFSEQITFKLGEIINLTKDEIDGKIETSGKIGDQAVKVVGGITVAAIIMAILIAFFNARTINRPIRILRHGIQEMAEGTFEKHLQIPSPPEIKEVANAFNRMSDRLKEIDEMKADFVSHVSHELRTPLAIIREAVSLLSIDDTATGLGEKQHKLLNIVRDECERLIDSVNKILDLSRMEAGMWDYCMEKVSLVPLIQQSTLKLTPILQKKDIRLELDSDHNNLPLVAVDSEKIAQVMNSLLENALKFTPDGGRILVKSVFEGEESSESESPAAKGHGVITVSVSDSGCGIPEESQIEIFDKYKMLHGKGTGLGLYIARHIVDAHGGNIWVESIQGKGSTFSFTIPVS